MKTKKIKKNPLDALFVDDEENLEEEAVSAPHPPVSKKPARKTRKKAKVGASISFDIEVLERIRNAVYALSGPPHRMTLASFAEGPLRRALEELEREHNGGRPFPPR